MRNRYLKYNTITSIIYQIIVIICGFILPRAILGRYGSEVNGLINSITQFLSIIALMDMGVGAAVSSTLYKPLAEKNWEKVSEIISAAIKFFNKLAFILIVYVAILCFIYPFINNSGFNFWFTASLIIIISVNSFSQFYLGIVDNILLGADQKAYIIYISNTITHLLNTVLCIAFISLGYGIHVVKLTTALIYIIRPTLVRFYVRRNYPIKRNALFTKETLNQKWNAMAQHVSECVLDFTDIMVLTIFSTLSNVSIYSVYNMIVYNMKQFFLISTNGTLSLMGNMWAQDEKEELTVFFDKMEFLIHGIVVLIFGVTYVLLVPFIRVYTRGVTDANYVQPMFAFFICLAHALHCLRLPYFNLIKAVGHYKQTQYCFVIATIMNIMLSIVLVNKYGLIGVAIGTLVAMLFQTLWLCMYCYRHLLNKKMLVFYKRIFIDIVSYVFIVGLSAIMDLQCDTYLELIVCAVQIFLFSTAIVFFINYIMDFKRTKQLIGVIKVKFSKREKC